MLKKLTIAFICMVGLLCFAEMSAVEVSAAAEWYDVPGVVGGQLQFDKATGTITSSERTITIADIPSTIEGVSVKEIGDYAFFQLRSLTSVTIPASVTTINEKAFNECTNLSVVNIGNNVTTIGERAFWECTSLSTVIIGNNVTTIEERAFWECDSLESIIIPDSVTTIGNYAFLSCKKLNIVDIGNNVSSIGYGAFSGCVNLTSVNIPDSIITIGNSAFSNCDAIETIEIPASVTQIGDGAFINCDRLTAVNVSLSNPSYSSIDGVLYDKKITEIIQFPQAKSGHFTIPGSVTSVGGNEFLGCTGLTSITIPDSVVSIGYGAFSYCTSLTSITIPNSVTTISLGAFTNCTRLKSINVSSMNLSYSSIDGVLYDKEITEIIQFPQAKSGHFTIPDSVTSIGGTEFLGCTGLTSITIPDSVVSIGTNAFSGCTSLTTITIPDSVTTIEQRAFYGCSSLITATIGDGVTTIGDLAFNQCNNLTTVTLGNGVTTIGRSAFYWCTNLTTVTIGNGVTTIGAYAFSLCDSLTTVYYSGTNNQWRLIDLTSHNTDLTSANIIYQSLGNIDTDSSGSKSSSIEINEKLDISTLSLPTSLKNKTLVLESSNPSVASVSGVVVTGVNVGDVVLSLKEAGKDVGYTYKLTVVTPDIGFDNNSINLGAMPSSGAYIEAPAIQVGDYSFPLYEYQLEANLDSLSSTFDTRVEYDMQTHEMKISIGVGRDDNASFDEIKELASNFNEVPSAKFEKKFNNLTKDLKASKAKLGFDFDTYALGYVVYDYKTGVPLFKEGTLIVGCSTSLSYKYSPIPVVYAKVAISAGFSGKLTFEVVDVLDASKGLNAALDIPIELGLTLAVGGDIFVASAEGGVEAKLGTNIHLPASSIEKLLRVYFSADIYFEHTVLWLFSDKYVEEIFNIQLYPHDDEDVVPSLGYAQAENYSFDEMMPRTTEYENVNSDVNYSINTETIKQQNLIDDNIFQSAEPAIMEINNKKIAVWEEDDQTRTDNNRTVLNYSIYSGGSWSAPSAVDDDGTADASPILFVMNNELFVVWKNFTREFDNTATVEQLVSGIGLSVAKFDGSSFTKISDINTNGKYPTAVDVAVNGGEVKISWVDNSENDLFGEGGTFNIHSSNFNGNTASTATSMVSGNVKISNLATYYQNNNHVISYVEDQYQGNELVSSELKTLSGGTSTTLATTNTDQIKHLDVSPDLKLIWVVDNVANIKNLSDDTLIQFNFSEGESESMVKYIAGETPIVLYSVSTGFGKELVARTYNANGFSEPIALTADARNIKYFSGLIDSTSKNLSVLFASSLINENAAPGNSIYEQTELRELTLTDAIDLQIVGEPYYDPSGVIPGGALTMFVDVKNNSSVPISSVNASVAGGTASTKSIILQPGEVGTIEVLKSISYSFVSDSFPITITPASGSDAYSAYNSVTVNLFYRDIEIVGYEVEGRQATVTVKNNSKQTVNNISVELIDERLDGTVLETLSIATLTSGASSSVIFTLPGEGLVVEDVYDVEYFYVRAEITQPENVYANNHMSAPVAPKRVESVTISNSSITIAGGETAQIQASVLPTDAFNKELFYVMADESIAEVDETGVITGLKKGETSITVISRDNAIMQTVLLEVTSTVVRISGEVSFNDATTDTKIELYAPSDADRNNALFSTTLEKGDASNGIVTKEFSVNTEPGTYDVVITKDNCLPYEIKGVVVPVDGAVDLTKHENEAINSIHLVTGDVNNDDTVNGADIQAIFDNDDYNQNVIIGLLVDADADVNGDGIINFLDTAIIRNSKNFDKALQNCVVAYTP